MEVKSHLTGGIEAVLSSPDVLSVVSAGERRRFWECFYGWAASHTVEGPLWFEVGPVVKALPFHEGGWAPRVEQVGPGVWLAHAVYLPGLYGRRADQVDSYGALNPPGANYKPTLEEARAEAQRLAAL